MDLDPNEIFSSGEMPKTYQELARLDVPLKLITQFPMFVKAVDIVELHRIDKLAEHERAEGVKRVITSISTRSSTSLEQSQASHRRIRL